MDVIRAVMLVILFASLELTAVNGAVIKHNYITYTKNNEHAEETRNRLNAAVRQELIPWMGKPDDLIKNAEFKAFMGHVHTEQKRAAVDEGVTGDHGFWHLKQILLIAGAALLVLVICLALCGWCFCRKRGGKSRKKLKEEDTKKEEFENTLITSANHNDATANGGGNSDEEKKLLSTENVVNNFHGEEMSSEPSGGEMEVKSAPIRKGQLANVVQQLASTQNGYKNEYDELRGKETATYEYSQKDSNKPKNRFKNILPYDHSLVVLTDELGGDYINASYITGYNGRKKAYIATQGPIDSTIADFWRMIWQEETTEIMMLANLIENKKKKCSKYWPDQAKTAVYGPVTVHSVKECKEPLNYTVRHFEISKEGEEKREVRQYHFTAWGDMSDITSATPIWEILKQMRSERKKPVGEEIKDVPPIVIHCSAGCGRTGTVITLDVMRQMMKRDNQVDIFNFINQMRTERMMTVQVVSQYRFIYESLLIYMRLKRTHFPSSKFVEKVGIWEVPAEENTMSVLQKQFQLLKFLHPELEDTKETKAGLAERNKNKNRDLEIIPDDINRPLLQTRVEDDETSTDYINACFFNGYSKRSLFIATQAPMENTYTDFWRMLFDYKAETIVSFHGKDRTVYPNYWPSDSAELGPFVIVQKGEEKVTDYLMIRDFELRKEFKGSEKNSKNIKNIKQYCIHNFDDLAKDQQAALLIELITQRVKPRQETNDNARITVHCEYGIGFSAIFIALYTAISMLQEDNQIDVFTIVKLMRMSRHNMLDTFDKYQLLNEAVKYYIQNPPPASNATSTDEEREDMVYVNLT